MKFMDLFDIESTVRVCDIISLFLIGGDDKMKCNDCAHYSEEKVKEGEKKMQPAVLTALQGIIADRGYTVVEINTFSGAKFVGTDIQIKFNKFLLTKCVYCNDQLFSTIQNISEVRILFFS